MFKLKSRPLRLARSGRGLAPLATLGVAAVAGAGAVYWQSGWRIERTDDEMVCGVEKDILRLSGKVLAPLSNAKLDSKPAACADLSKRTELECPLFATSAITSCNGVGSGASLQQRERFPQTSLTPDTGLWADANTKARVKAIETLSSVSPKLSRAIADWAASVSADSWLAGGAKSIITIQGGGGAACTKPYESAYYLSSSAGFCLGAAISNSAFVTAAHCIPKSHLSLKVTCDSDTVTVDKCHVAKAVAWANCPPSSVEPTGDCVKDIAVCTLKTTSAKCSISSANEPTWVDPGRPSKPVFTTMRSSGTCAVKLDAADVEAWPPDASSKSFVRAKLKGSDQPTTWPADSGGAVFDSDVRSSCNSLASTAAIPSRVGLR